MSEQASEKQHQATGKKLDDLKKQGQTLRSRDLSGGLVFISAIISLIFMSSYMSDIIKNNFIKSFTSIRFIYQFEQNIGSMLISLIFSNFFMLIPIFIVTIVMALLSPFVFGGWNFTFQAIEFKFEKLNPISNLSNLFSKKVVLNVIKSTLKVSIIMGVLAIYSYNNINEIIQLEYLPIDKAIHGAFMIVMNYVVVISVSLIVIILYDVATNYFEFQNKVKMTTQELKDEYKETEGNADVKRKLRSNQMALLKQRLSVTVPQATVIITNPTHYAIALRYDESKDRAPKVVAKGKDFLAQQIRKIAVANRIPIYQAPQLARAIYRTSKLNSEVNPGLYMSVAIVLSYIHQLNNYQQGVGQQPQMASDLKIPSEFIYEE